MSENSPSLSDEYDGTQSKMMGEMVILVDENDKQIGSMSKVDSHLGEGFLHRAFSVLLFNSSQEMLIHKRADTKITFPSVWANSCCSHPLDVEGETEMEGDLGVKRAAIRKMKQELGISADQLPIDDFHLITRMHYRARADEKWIEHELDHILLIQADVELDINPNEISEIRWVNQSQIEDLITNSPNNGEIIAPWFNEIYSRFASQWWGHLDEVSSLQEDVVHHIGDVSTNPHNGSRK
ncbi:MAG: isopentenyl-diphosphate delta-isomerase [Methanobacteriota archaeon]|nr:MAG: isopentenyl-diphosphate delta-isomerase [Euryarchaeota archaeon]